nr:hypothetical protein [uncultured Bacteroides sp.]
MKTQINDLKNGRFFEVGTNRSIRLSVSEKVISENMEGMKIQIRGCELNLVADWSRSRKTVAYRGDLPINVYNELLGDHNLPKVDPRATIVINGDMTIMIYTNSRKQKMAYSYIKEEEIQIL